MIETTTAGVRTTRGISARARTRKAGRNAWWLAPFLVFALVFGAYPFVQVVKTAFSAVDLRDGAFVSRFDGASNFAAVFSEFAAWRAVGNTVLFVVVATAATLVAGMVLALLVDRATATLVPARNVLVWPAVVAPVVVSLMWLLLLSPTVGGVNKVLASLGLPEQAWLNSGAGSMVSVLVLDTWHWTPVVFLFVFTALKGIDPALLEAGRIDGATETMLLRRIVIPLLGPTLATVSLVRVVMSVKAFDEMYLLTGGGPNGATTLVSQHIRDLFFTQLRFGDAAAYGLVVVFVTALVLGLLPLVRSARRSPR